MYQRNYLRALCLHICSFMLLSVYAKFRETKSRNNFIEYEAKWNRTSTDSTRNSSTGVPLSGGRDPHLHTNEPVKMKWKKDFGQAGTAYRICAWTILDMKWEGKTWILKNRADRAPKVYICPPIKQKTRLTADTPAANEVFSYKTEKLRIMTVKQTWPGTKIQHSRKQNENHYKQRGTAFFESRHMTVSIARTLHN